jgi:hypothetical protein
MFDIHDGSHICVFSCYSKPDSKEIRTLKIKNKIDKTKIEIDMCHNSVVVFDTNVNSNHLHKIVLNQCNMDKQNNEWLGITFRRSKTHIKFINEMPYFYTNEITQLYLANDEERQQFYSLRSFENKQIDFKYPDIKYTINPSDLIMSE